MRTRLGQLPDLLPDLSSFGPGLVYVKLQTPIGTAIVDPFAASQDQTTQEIMQRLGISVTIGVGAAPAPDPGETSLMQNLAIGVPLALGGLAFLLRPKLSTALVAGGVVLLLNAGALTSLFAPAAEVGA